MKSMWHGLIRFNTFKIWCFTEAFKSCFFQKSRSLVENLGLWNEKLHLRFHNCELVKKLTSAFEKKNNILQSRGFKHFPYGDKLSELGLFSLEKGPEGPSSGLPISEGGLQESWKSTFCKVCSNRVRGNGFKLEEGRFRVDIRKKFFTVRVVRHWNRLPSEVVDAPLLETFKARLDGAVSNLV